MGDLVLRLARQGDVPAMLDIYAPHVLRGAASFETELPGEEEFARRLEALRGVFPWLVCERRSVVAGYAYASRQGERRGYDWAAAASVYIGEGARGGGLGRALYGALAGLLRAQGYRKLLALVSCPNPASEHFHEALGFVREGLLRDVGYKFGKALSVAYYGLDLLPAAPNPPPPLRLDALDPAVVDRMLQQG